MHGHPKPQVFFPWWAQYPVLNTAGHLDPAPPSKFCPSPWDTGHWVTSVLKKNLTFPIMSYEIRSNRLVVIGLNWYDKVDTWSRHISYMCLSRCYFLSSAKPNKAKNDKNCNPVDAFLLLLDYTDFVCCKYPFCNMRVYTWLKFNLCIQAIIQDGRVDTIHKCWPYEAYNYWVARQVPHNQIRCALYWSNSM